MSTAGESVHQTKLRVKMDKTSVSDPYLFATDPDQAFFRLNTNPEPGF
jgi:hypothetical protein